MSLQRVPLKDYRGGLNTRDGPFDLQANESPDLQDVTISALVGTLETRKGKVRFDTAGMPTESPDYMKQVTVGTHASVLMLSINGSIWVCNGAGVVTKLFAGTAGTVWSFEVFSDLGFKDWVYCANGVDAMQKWDGEAAATVAWPVEKGTLPKGSILKVWENRMFISGVAATPQRIFFSEFGDPQAGISEYGFVDVRGPEEDLDSVQDLAVLGARLIILKRRSIFFISSAVTMANRRIGGPGVWGRFQTVELEDKLYFFNPQGLWSTGGVEVAMESGQINNWFPTHLTQTAYDKVRLCATKDTYPRLLMSLPTDGSTINNKVIEMIPHINFRRIGGRRYLLLPAFMLHTITASSLACFNPTGHEETIVGASVASNTPDTIATNDTFIRAEEDPLSNGGKWSAWAFVANIGKIGKKVGEFVEAYLGKVEGTNFGARWNVAEIKNPWVRMDIVNSPLSVGLEHVSGSVSLNACFQAVLRTGYSLTVKYSKAIPAGVKCTVSIVKWEGGVGTTLAKKSSGEAGGLNKFIEKGDRLAFRVLNGNLTGWVKHQGSEVWELLLEAADTTFNKGYSGLLDEEAGKDVTQHGTYHNFATAEATQVGRISTLFKGTDDEGVAIQAHWQSAWLAIQAEEPKERLRRLNAELSGDVIVDVFVDFGNVSAFTDTFPKAEVGEPNQYRFERVRPETRGRFHSVRFRTDPVGEPFLINSAELVIRGGKEH